ncbi:MAG: hypothetical protein FJ004_10980 [Chloroflexi bacterium]|nr:hypothetical protein [Chloroflexota bacterium]
MRNSIVLLTLLLALGFVITTMACNNGDEVEPTPASEPSPVLATPEAIDWAAIATRISQLAVDNGLIIYEVSQLTEDIIEVAVEGECADFPSLVDAEPDLMLVGKPQLDPQGICTMWFRVLLLP